MPAKVSDLMAHARMAPPKDSAPDIAAIMMHGQTMMADIITRNFKGEICSEVQAEITKAVSSLEASLKGYIAREIAALPVPERVIERTVETVTEREEPEEEAPKAITVQRKDGAISSVKVGDTSYDVIRNKQGQIKEVKPRG